MFSKYKVSCKQHHINKSALESNLRAQISEKRRAIASLQADVQSLERDLKILVDGHESSNSGIMYG